MWPGHADISTYGQVNTEPGFLRSCRPVYLLLLRLFLVFLLLRLPLSLPVLSHPTQPLGPLLRRPHRFLARKPPKWLYPTLLSSLPSYLIDCRDSWSVAVSLPSLEEGPGPHMNAFPKAPLSRQASSYLSSSIILRVSPLNHLHTIRIVRHLPSLSVLAFVSLTLSSTRVDSGPSVLYSK